MSIGKLLLSLAILVLTLAHSQSKVTPLPQQALPTLSQRVAFLAYTAKFGKSYSSTTEFNSRFQLWLATDNYIRGFQNDQVALQHNKFSDWSHEERNGILNSKLGQELLDLPAKVQLGLVTAKSCPSGQYLSRSSCLACPTGCASCVSKTFCTACLTTNFFYNSTSKLCTCTIGPLNTAKTDCVPCASGTFFNGVSCVNCLANCTTCTSTTTCSLCANNQQFIGGKCVCNGPSNSTGWCTPCASSEYFANNVCNSCPGNCTTCTVGTGSCTTCAASFTLSAGRCVCAAGKTLVNGLCTTAITCTTGTYNLNNTCAPCPSFCASCLSGSTCTSCVNNGLKIVNATDVVPCRNCDPTFLNTPIGQCRCPPNFFLIGSTCQALTSCTTPATYNRGDNTCVACESLCATCASFSGWCYSTTHPSILIDQKLGTVYCPTNTFLQNQQCVPLIKCPIGQYNDGGNNCLACQSNCDVCTNVTGVCQTCSPTYTLNQDKSCSCIASTQFLDVNTPTNTGTCIDVQDCGNGFYNPGYNNCTACVANCAICSDKTGVCTQCLPTYTLGNDQCACNPDPTIQWLNPTTKLCEDIITCPAGKYNDGNNNCLACPANCATCSFKTGICSACNATFTADTANNACKCNINQFMTATTNGVCQACNALCPTCDDLTGNCLSCVNNLVVNTATPKRCACTAGNYLNTVNNMCTTCPVNCTTCIDGTGLCNGCVSTYTLTSGACACTSIQAYAGGLCLDMAACPSGYYNQGNNVCTLGPVNCTTVTVRTGICSTCNTTFTYDSSTNTCKCSSNQFLNSSGYCQTCPQNCSTCDSSGACTGCQSTYTLQGSKCACNTTTTNQALVGGSCVSLTSCPPGKYNTGINTCLTCPLSKCGACNTYTGVCTACASTFTATLDSAGAVQSCGCISGQYLNNNGQCQACPQNCTTCSDGTGLCTACGVGFTMNLPTTGACACNVNTQAFVNGACVGLTTCPAAQYASNINVCTNCPTYCTVCSQIYGQCSTCQKNLVVKSTNTCGCVNNTFAFDGSQCQRCNVWVTNCDTCNSAGTCTSCQKGYVVSGNSCVCNTGSGQYLDSTGQCNYCPANCTTCYSHGNGYNFPAGHCSGCVSTFTATNNQLQLYYAPSGYSWGWYAIGTSNSYPPYLSPGQWAYQDGPPQTTPYIEGTQMPPNVCNNQWPYYWIWQWNGQTMQGVTVLYNRCDYCYGCWWQYFYQSYRTYTCACVTGTQTKNMAGQCAAIITCPAQQYNDGTNTCKNCASRCTACSYQNAVCTQCYTGATYNSGSNVCSCPVGQYGSTSNLACNACPTNCLVCAENTGICTTCANNLEIDTVTGICGCPQSKMLALVGGYCVPMTTPALGYYNPGNNTAIQCATPNCYNCTAYSGTCNTCNSSFVMSGSSCVCASGRYKTSAGVCQNCPQNCTGCADFTGACSSCVSTFTLNLPTTGYCACASNVPAVVNGACAVFLVCPAGQYNPGNNVCYACPDNCATCDAWTGTCNACKTSFTFNSVENTCKCRSTQYLASSNVCTDCAANCTTCADTTGTCTSCSSSFSLNTPTTGKCGCMLNTQALVGGACVALISCPDGQYNPGNNVCTACASDCATCQAYTGTCSQCNPTFVNGTTANTCVCPTSQFKNSTSLCQACDSKCTACTSLTACTTCVNTFSNNNGICGCQSGYYLSSATNRCVVCPNNCTSCQDGVGTCVTCSATFDVQPDGFCRCNPVTEALVSGSCVPLISCPIGQYNPGNNVCTACTSDCYTCVPYTGQCSECMPSFTYNQTPNTCTCTTSEYKTSSNTCVNCAANCTTCADSTGLCTGCVATFTQNTPSTGQCGCLPTTQALFNGQCVSLLGCSTPGRYNPGDNTCVNCLTPNCFKCSNYTGICETCQPTYTLSDTKTCICNANQFTNSLNQCQNCANNCSACDSPSGACNTCVDTFTLDSVAGTCKCTGDLPVYTGASCEAMIVCPDGQFNPGNNVCSNCPANAATCADLTGLITSCQTTFTQDNTSNTCKCTSVQYLTTAGTCENCPQNCTACANLTGLCTKCAPSMTLSTAKACSCLATQTLVNGLCVAINTCPSGQYNPGTNVCQKCSSTCTACSYWTGACTACKTSFTLNSDGTCSCLSNQFANQTTSTTQKCINCPVNCATCSAPKGSCTKCIRTFTLTNGACNCLSSESLFQAQCVAKPICSSNEFVNATNQCQSCPNNCTACSSLTTCTACDSTFTLASGKCSCKSGQALINSGTTCTSTFTVCPTGQYNDGTNTCRPMPANCTKCNNTGYCSTCKKSFTTNTPSPGKCGCNKTTAIVNGVCVKPKTCPTGQYNLGNNVCAPCASNCSKCTQFTGACTACKSSFKLSSGKCVCSATQAFMNNACTALYNCTAGNYNPGNNTCAPCVANCVSCSAFTGTCTKCATGYTLGYGFCQPLNRLLQSFSCASNCLKCDQTSGECLQCAPNSVRRKEDPASCEECNYAVGPVGNATICLAKPSSSDRVVPEFGASDQLVDWRSWSVVGAVKDQGKCGGDFAFSTAAAAETSYAIKTGLLYDLSEQYLLDCDVNSFGCSGGFQQTSSKLLATDGAVLEQDYPYVGQQTGCRGNQLQKVFRLKYPGSEPVTSNKEAFKAALRKGPLNISFRVTDDSFFFYGRGILPGNLCPMGNLNHAMLAVGYGVENSVEYALIQNQWGVGWGEQGLLRVQLTDDQEGPCGLYTRNFVPTL